MFYKPQFYELTFGAELARQPHGPTVPPTALCPLCSPGLTDFKQFCHAVEVRPQTWTQMIKHIRVNEERSKGEQYRHIPLQKAEKIFWSPSYKPTPGWLLTKDSAADNYIVTPLLASIMLSPVAPCLISRICRGETSSKWMEMGSFSKESRAAQAGFGTDLPPVLSLTHSLRKRWS